MPLRVIKVETGAHIKEFLEFPVRLNKNNPEYIRPLDQDIEKVFDPKKNKFFRHGECERFLCLDDQDKTVGKFAVFVNKKYKQDQPTGGIGFVDFIDDISVSETIFEYAKKWLKLRDMEAMDGPINFGERDSWWGLLVQGFHAPLYNMNYNLPYYRKHFEAYGFREYFNQLCFGRTVHSPLSANFTSSHERVKKQYPHLRIDTIKKKNLEKYAADFVEVYNKAWASHGQGKQLELKQGIKLFNSMKAVIDPNIAYIVYDGETPIAIWINLPDLNQWFKYLNGQFTLFHKLKFLWKKKTVANTKMVGLVFGIVPEWQKKGIDGYMITEGYLRVRSNMKYLDYEMQWIGDFNPKMISIAKSLETEVTRQLTTFRYLFDRTKEYKRHPMLS